MTPFLPVEEKLHPPFSDYPNLRVHITTLKCGAVAIGFSLPHCLADAETFRLVIASWSRAYNDEQDIKAPIFAPRDIDKWAVSLDKPDLEAMKIVNSLPIPDYDFWGGVIPEKMKFLTSGPDELIAKEPLGTPVRYVFSEACYKFKFSREQLHSIYDQINREATIKVSHQIALVAHMWTAINRARNFGESDCANFTTLISMRSKLPEGDYSNYAGSFVGGGQVSCTGTSNAVACAVLITQMLRKYTKDISPCILHRLAMHTSPYRRSLLNFSDDSILYSTWISPNFRNRNNKIRFGNAKLSFFEESAVPINSILHVSEVYGDKPNWYENGAYVYFTSKKKVLDSILNDPLFKIST